AEDGIRDFHVTGVQTCALPISFSGSEDLGGGLAATFRLSHRFDVETGGVESGGKPFWHDEATVGLKGDFGRIRLGRALSAIWSRSEERRVGKECRSGWAPRQ